MPPSLPPGQRQKLVNILIKDPLTTLEEVQNTLPRATNADLTLALRKALQKAQGPIKKHLTQLIKVEFDELHRQAHKDDPLDSKVRGALPLKAYLTPKPAPRL